MGHAVFIVALDTFADEISYIEQGGLRTPVTFFSEAHMLEALALMQNGLSNTSDLYYALKSCYHPPLLKSIACQGLGAEVLSEMEFNLAKANGFTRFIVNGMGRTRSFFEKVLAEKDVCIIVDSEQDIEHLQSIAGSIARPISVGFRFAIDVTSGSSYYQTTTHKLGNSFDGALFKKFIALCKQESFVWDLMHAHSTINELNEAVYLETISILQGYVEDLKKQNIPIPSRIDIGGGFEVFDPANAHEFSSLFTQIASSFRAAFPEQKLVLEPGRYLSAYAGYTIGVVQDIKKREGKYWIITDIGTNTLIPIPNARYSLLKPLATKEGLLVGITDGITSPSNNIITDTRIAELPRRGDYICIGNTGAYTDVYSTFWAYPPHEVVFRTEQGVFQPYRTQEDIQQLYRIFFKD